MNIAVAESFEEYPDWWQKTGTTKCMVIGEYVEWIKDVSGVSLVTESQESAGGFADSFHKTNKVILATTMAFLWTLLGYLLVSK